MANSHAKKVISAETGVNHGMKISNKPSGLSANVYNVYNVQFKKNIHQYSEQCITRKRNPFHT